MKERRLNVGITHEINGYRAGSAALPSVPEGPLASFVSLARGLAGSASRASTCSIGNRVQYAPAVYLALAFAACMVATHNDGSFRSRITAPGALQIKRESSATWMSGKWWRCQKFRR